LNQNHPGQEGHKDRQEFDRLPFFENGLGARGFKQTIAIQGENGNPAEKDEQTGPGAFQRSKPDAKGFDDNENSQGHQNQVEDGLAWDLFPFGHERISFHPLHPILKVPPLSPSEIVSYPDMAALHQDGTGPTMANIPGTHQFPSGNPGIPLTL
jgi:hypothetical protein